MKTPNAALSLFLSLLLFTLAGCHHASSETQPTTESKPTTESQPVADTQPKTKTSITSSDEGPPAEGITAPTEPGIVDTHAGHSHEIVETVPSTELPSETGTPGTGSMESETKTVVPETKETKEEPVSLLYKDGTYSKQGTYQSHAGDESIEITLVLKSDTVSEVQIVSNAEHDVSKKMQGLFIAGINAEVVGKKINELSVGKVNGSSLTGNGFNQALESIKSEAKK